MDFAHPVEALIPGAPGRLLAALAKVDAELPVSRLAVIAGVGRTRASVVLGDLARLGVVSRRQVGPTTLVRLDRENVGGEIVACLGGLRQRVIIRLREQARDMEPQPVSLVIFGSFARGTADASSDIDVLAVRPATAEPDSWSASLTRFAESAESLTGNRLQILDYGVSDIRRRYSARSEDAGGRFWQSVSGDAITLVGVGLRELVRADDDTWREETPG
jgi:predicted nucleotidyltransferase